MQQALRPLPAFLALAFTWSWSCWLLAAATRSRWPLAGSVLLLAGSFGPSLAAVVLVYRLGGRAGLRAWLRHCLQWRIGWGWLALALLLPAGMAALAFALHLSLGGAALPSAAAGHAGWLVVNFFLVFVLGGPLGEEFGWRGLALPILQTRFSWRLASVALGLVWAVWHLPLLFITGSTQAHIPPGLFLVSVVALSVLLGWLVRHTAGSVVGVLLLHTAINFLPSLVPVLSEGAGKRPFALLVGMLTLLAAGLLALDKP